MGVPLVYCIIYPVALLVEGVQLIRILEGDTINADKSLITDVASSIIKKGFDFSREK